MRLSSALKLAALLVVALAVGLVAAVKSMNLDGAKTLLTEQVKAATGRTLAIAGPLELQLGLIPRVVANGVTLSNPPGASAPDMVKIERIEAEMALLPLLRREIRVNRLIVSAPEVLIETGKGGNLNFQPPGTVAGPSQAAKDTPAYGFTLREVKLKNGAVTWRNRDTGVSERIAIHKLTILPEQTPNGLLDLRVIGQARQRMFEIAGAVGGPDLIAARKPLPVHLKASTDGMVLTAEGSVADVNALSGIDLKLAFKGDELGQVLQLAEVTSGDPLPLGPFKLAARLADPAGVLGLSEIEAAVGKRDSLLVGGKGSVKDIATLSGVDLGLLVESDNLAGLSPLAGASVPSMGPVKLSGQLRGGKPAWKLEDLKAGLAGSEMVGELALTTGARTRIAGKLVGNVVALNDFLTPAARPGEKLAPKAVKAVPGGDGKLIPDVAIPTEALRAVDVDMAVQATKLVLNAVTLDNLALDMHLAGGRLSIKTFQAGMAGGTVQGDASLDASGKRPQAQLRLNANQVELGKMLDNGYLSGGKSDLRIDLRGQGDTVRALAASAGGEMVLSVGPGRLQNKALDWAGGDVLSQLVDTFNPMTRKEDSTGLSCAAVRFTLQDGLATARKGVGIRTDRVDVVGSGTVNLKSEALDMGFAPKAREGVGLSLSAPLAGMTRLRGTLAHPAVGLDEEGAARTAASMGAAMATGGLSVLGEMLWDKMSGDTDPCRVALGQSAAPSKGKAPAKKKSGGFLEGLFGR